MEEGYEKARRRERSVREERYVSCSLCFVNSKN